jgi:NADH:ubiquinone oxidoreductase subunit F (NADH-binding)
MSLMRPARSIICVASRYLLESLLVVLQRRSLRNKVAGSIHLGHTGPFDFDIAIHIGAGAYVMKSRPRSS